MQQEKFGTDTPLYHKQRFNQRGQLWDMRLSTVSFAEPENGDRGSIVNFYTTANNYQQGISGTDNNGNLLRQKISIPGSDFFQQTYDYDQLNRLKSVAEKLNGAGNDTFKQAYLYDRWGNRRIDQANTTANVPHPEFSIDPNNNNRLVAPSGYTFEYDAAGNQKKDTFTLNDPNGGNRTFDAENRMIAAQNSNARKYEWTYYTYNGDGQRVRRNTTGYEIWQVYGFDGELLAEYPQTGPSVAVAQPQKEYGYRNGQLLVTAEPFANRAWNMPATQTDNYASTTTADRAVNGDVDGGLSNGSTSATNSHPNSWWQVDLQSVKPIDSITVWGRTDCCPEMTSNFYVFVSDNPFASYDLNTTLNQSGVSNYYYSGFAGPASINVNRTGRYVRVQLAGTNSLALAEVQVWGQAAKVEWLVTDHLGTPRIIVDKTGSTAGISRHDYLPFGEELFAGIGGRSGPQGYTSSDGERQQFTGYERDVESGLDYAEARYYASAQGRFTSGDPVSTLLVDRLVDPQRINLYAYSRNNPLAFTDVTGLKIDPSQLSDADRKNWDQVVALANEKDQYGDYVNPELHSQYERLEQDTRTFVIVNKDLGQQTVGLFEITKFSDDRKDFTEAKINLNFKLIKSKGPEPPEDLVPALKKFQGLIGKNGFIQRLAEVFGHEAAHGEYALKNPSAAVKLQLLVNETNAATIAYNAAVNTAAKHKQKLQPPPDLIAKQKAKAAGLRETELFALQKELLINSELSPENKRCKKR